MPDFTYEFPYPSQRLPVFAKNAVATSQPLAAQAGLDMLQRGGNAADAAVATAIALTVVEPTSNGIGSDNFALIWAGGGLHGLNASGRAPRAMTPDHYSGMERIPYYGWHGVTTPGAVSGWVAVSEKFGALPFADLFEPAIRYAREGFLVSPQTAYYWNLGASRYDGDEFKAWHDTFAPGGRAPQTGELFRSEGHARTLERIAETKGEAFYRGDLAEKIAAASQAGDGALSMRDLESHQADWVRPISLDYHNHELHEIPPNGQGLAALLMLGVVREFDMPSLAVDSVEALHLQIEAMKVAFADGHRYIADPDAMDVAAADLLDPAYLRERARLIDPDKAQDFQHGEPKHGGTVYLTAADADGMMVSFIQSNYTGFGSGMVVPGTGIALQNRGCCFTLEKGHPNEVGPGKRPYHTIIPGFVTTRTGGSIEPLMSFGVMGGFMQPQGHAQVLIRIADWNQNPQAALDAPRWRVNDGMSVTIEPGFDASLYDGLEALGHEVTIANARTVSHGRGQIIYRLDDGYLAASDQRSDGQAVGY
ncbi:MAG: gamma-glutamyltransferase family protein [Phycisphaerales bacterium]